MQAQPLLSPMGWRARLLSLFKSDTMVEGGASGVISQRGFSSLLRGFGFADGLPARQKPRIFPLKFHPVALLSWNSFGIIRSDHLNHLDTAEAN
jgi:hypothetical protein